MDNMKHTAKVIVILLLPAMLIFGCTARNVEIHYSIESIHGEIIGIGNTTAAEGIEFHFSRAVVIDLKIYYLNGTWPTFGTNMSYKGKTDSHRIDIYVQIPQNATDGWVSFYYKIKITDGPLLTGDVKLDVKVAENINKYNITLMNSQSKTLAEGKFSM